MEKFHYFRPKLSSRHLLIILKTTCNAASTDVIERNLLAATSSAILVLDEASLLDSFDRENNFPGINRELRSIINDQKLTLNIRDENISVLGIGRSAEMAAAITLKMNFGMAIMLEPSIENNAVDGPKEGISKRIIQSTAANYEDSTSEILLISSNTTKYNYLSKLKHFRFVFSENKQINSEAKMVIWAAPLVASFITMRSYGLSETHSRTIGREPKIAEFSQAAECLAAIRSTRVVANRINIVGYGVVDGLEATRYGDQRSWIEFEKQGERFRSVVGAVPDPMASVENWYECLVDYSIGGFASFGHLGLDLEYLPVGKYTMGISVENKMITRRTNRISSADSIQAWGNDGSLYVYAAANSVSKLCKYPVTQNSHGERYFVLTKNQIMNGRLYIEGQFAVQGQPMPDWSSGQYMLTLQGPVTRSYPLAKLNSINQSTPFSSDYLDYSKAFFSTQNQNGLLLDEDLPEGEYSAFVHFILSDILYTEQCESTLLVEQEYRRHFTLTGSAVTENAVNESLIANSAYSMDPEIKSLNPEAHQVDKDSICIDLQKVLGQQPELFDPSRLLTALLDKGAEEPGNEVVLFDLLPSALFLLNSAGMTCDSLSRTLANAPCKSDHQQISDSFSIRSLEHGLNSYASNLSALPDLEFFRKSLVLHRIQLPKEFEVDGERIFFDPATINSINETLNKLHLIFERVFSLTSIDVYSNGMRAKRRSNLKEYGSPLVYESNYYQKFSRELNKVIEVKPKFSII